MVDQHDEQSTLIDQPTLKDVVSNFSEDSKILKNEVLKNNNLIKSFVEYIKNNYKEKVILQAFELKNIDELPQKLQTKIEKKLHHTTMIQAVSKIISSDLKDLANSFSQAKNFLWSMFTLWANDKVMQLKSLWSDFEIHLLDGTLEVRMISNKILAPQTIPIEQNQKNEIWQTPQEHISQEHEHHNHNHEIVHGTWTNKLLDMLWWSREEVEKLIVSHKFLGKKINVNKYMVPALQAAEQDIKKDPEASAYIIKVMWWWHWRNIRWWKTLSNHALWLAIDINPKENGFYPDGIDQTRRKDYYDIPDSFVSIMKHHGFIRWWDWKKPFDAMHFEYSNKDLLEKAKNDFV